MKVGNNEINKDGNKLTLQIKDGKLILRVNKKSILHTQLQNSSTVIY